MSDNLAARISAPEHDTARHPLTIKQASLLFAELRVPRAPRSVQRFCEHGYLDCIRVKGPKGDQFFINRESIECYAEELKQIEAIATIGAEARIDAHERAEARKSAPPEITSVGLPKSSENASKIAESDVLVQRLRDENLNLRIDNRGKEQAINFLTTQLREKDQSVHDLSYRLGAAETRIAQLEAPKFDENELRHTTPEPASDHNETIREVVLDNAEVPMPKPTREPNASTPRRSFFGRLFG
jgi:hypothetical protein